MRFTSIHPESVREVEQDARNMANDMATSYAYSNLMVAFGAYLRASGGRDSVDVASELSHLAARIGRVLES